MRNDLNQLVLTGIVFNDPVIMKDGEALLFTILTRYSSKSKELESKIKQTARIECIVLGRAAQAIKDRLHLHDEILVHGNLQDHFDGSGLQIRVHRLINYSDFIGDQNAD